MEERQLSKKKYTYFPGCMIPFRLPHFELTSREVLKQFDIELEANDNHSCCPEPTTFTGVDFEAWVSIAARNIAVSESTGLDTVALCSGCFHTLALVNHLLHEDPEVKERVNERLKKVGMKVTGNLTVKNILHVLHEDVGLEKIRSKITRPLTGIAIAPHYGCHLVRPLEASNMDDAENPMWFDDLIEATGATLVNYEDKMACCGAPIGPSDEEKAFKLTAKKLQKIREAGADAIVMICPTCYTQMEMQQRKATELFDAEYSIPVLALGEMLGLAMGMEDLVVNNSKRYHRVKLGPLLEKLKGGQ
jgi:heterodisulfide reductase subunit B